MRIAIAAARGLALVTAAKLYGTDSLTVMARLRAASGDFGRGPFAVAVDARRGMLYLGLYDEAARKLEGPLLIAPDEALHLASAKASGRGRERRGAAGRSRRAAGTRASKRGCLSFSQARARSPRSRYASGETLADPAPALSAAAGCEAASASGREALMAVEILVSRRAVRCAVAWRRFMRAASRSAWDEAAMAQFLAGPDALCLIGSAADGSGGAPAGFLIARKAADEAELLTLGVAPACRRIGLGRALL